MSIGGKILDYTPGVSNIKGAVEGNWDQAYFGPFEEAYDDAKAGVDKARGAKAGQGKMMTEEEAADYRRQKDANQAVLEQAQQQQKLSTDVMQVAADKFGTRDAQFQERAAPTVSSTGAQVVNAAAPQAVTSQTVNGAQIATGPQDQIRDQQQASLRNLMAAAAGKAPSVAQNQLQQTTQQNVAQQVALARTMQGANPGAALRVASDATANLNAQAAGQAATLRAAETAQARGELNQALATARNQDVSLATSQAQLNQEAVIKNQIADLQAKGMSLEAATKVAMQNAALGTATNQFNSDLGFKTSATNAENVLTNNRQEDVRRQLLADNYLRSLGMYQGAVDSRANTALSQRSQNNNYELGVANVDMQRYAADQAFYGSLVGGAGSLLTGALASDRRIKRDVKDGTTDVHAFLDALKPYLFGYVDDKPDTIRIGVMAQDVEATPKGKTLVKEIGGVKQIDVAQGLGAALASLAEIHGRLKAVEAKATKKGSK